MLTKIKDFFIHRVLRIPLTMRVRYDHCRSRNPKVTVIFLHGIASSYAAWKNILPELYADTDLSDVRFVALDLIGFGKSERPHWFKYDYASYRRVLTHTIKKLKIKTPIILAGHSMGCLISADYALNGKRRIEELLLVSPPIFRPRDIAQLPDKFYDTAYAKLSEHTDNVAIGTLATFVDAVSSFDKKTLNTEAFRKTMNQIILNDENWENFHINKTPMLVIHGRMDPLVSGSNLATLAKQNTHFELLETFGAHDISGVKSKKILSSLKQKLQKYL